MRYRETKATQRLPLNLYQTTNGKGTGAVYYRYKHPTTKKFHGMGKDKVEAIKAAKSLNDKLIGATSLVDSVLHPSTSVESLCDSYLAFKKNLKGKKALQKASIDEIRGAHKKIKIYFDGWNCRQLTTMAISQFLDGIYDPEESEGHARERDKTRKVFVATLNYGQTKGELDTNPATPCLKIGNPPEVERHNKDGWKMIYNAAEPWMQKAMDICMLTTQRRGDICNMKKENIKDGVLYVVQEKTHKHDTGYLAIQITPELNEVLTRTLGKDRVNIVSPYLIHRKPRAYTERQKAAGIHFSYINKDYLTKEFKRLRDDVTGAYDHLPMVQRPGFHQGRALAIHEHKKQGCAPQQLAGHASEKMTDNYDARHEDINWVDASLEGFSLAKFMG
tara:strand:- start:188 stop:1357 length:1170 start_codon:yes stop_codon:yes gene_type:complete